MDQDNPEVSVLIVSWNTRDLLAACLRSIIKQAQGLRYEVIVVDNASSDGSAAMVRQEFLGIPGFRFIENEANEGFAKGNNQAYAVSRGEIIALVNPDILFIDNALESLVHHIVGHPRAGIVSCDLVGDDGRSQAMHRRLPTLPLVFFVYSALGQWIDRRFLRGSQGRRYRLRDRQWKGLVVVEQAAAALAVLRRSTLERIGGLFDERFPIYGNDVDLCRRIRDAGFEAHVRYDISVNHRGSASLCQLKESRVVALRRAWLESYYALHESPWKRNLLRLMMGTNTKQQAI